MLINIKDDYSEKVRYDYPDFPVYIRRCLLSVFPNFTADRHWHDDVEFIYAVSGNMKYNINGTVVDINEGNGIFVNSKQLHYGFSDGTECDFICILFHPLLLCTSISLEERFVKPLSQGGASYILLDSSSYGDVLDKIYSIWEEKDKEAFPLYFLGNAALIWKRLFENVAPKEQNEAAFGKLAVLKRMMSFIAKNHKEKLTLEEIAASGGVSKRTCGNFFIKYLNQTPIDYLCDYRLRKSVELLKFTDMTILEISMEVGFSGAGYYAECFKRLHGISPSEYRKKHLKERKNGYGTFK